jgi:hypothetical protein
LIQHLTLLAVTVEVVFLEAPAGRESQHQREPLGLTILAAEQVDLAQTQRHQTLVVMAAGLADTLRL